MVHRYNLWDEPWLEVIDDQATVHKVSLTELLENAPQYQRISGDMATQDYAIFRTILAILQTTFTRYQSDGTVRPKRVTKKALHATWRDLWSRGSFPMSVIQKYRDEWHDRFNLYDSKYPFMQIPVPQLKDFAQEHLNSKSKKPGTIHGKTIKRTISESANKVSLTAPADQEVVKNHLTDASLARWLVTFQGYTGTSDKAKTKEMKDRGESASKGWLFNIGGIYLRGQNLFETLMLNLILDQPQKQAPIWEWSLEDKLTEYNANHPQNLADIYTNCARLVAIDPNTDLTHDEIKVLAIQFPRIESADGQIEPQTLWGRDKHGNNYPRTLDADQSLWQSFGLIDNTTVEGENKNKMPEVISWYRYLVGNDYVDRGTIGIVSIGMNHKSGDISNTPKGDITDELNLQNELFKPVNGRHETAILQEVDRTKRAVRALWSFGNDLEQLRQNTVFDPKARKKQSSLADYFKQQAYFQIDDRFKQHIAQMSDGTDINTWIDDWHRQLYPILLTQVESHIYPLQMSDLNGIPHAVKDSTVNVVTIYMDFKRHLYNILKKGE